jgi:hypothetical protein
MHCQGIDQATWIHISMSSKLLVEHTSSSCSAIQYNTIIHSHKHYNKHFYHILVDDQAKIVPCNKTLSFV